MAAGESWDALVARAVGEGWSGVECLSGIPGLVGATPIQNVGAYGQEVKETIQAVRVLDRRVRRCGEGDEPPRRVRFAYPGERLSRGDDRFVVLRVTLRARRVRGDSSARALRGARRALGVARGGACAARARREQTILALRRAKGMVLDPTDPESVSAGSFFVNPLLDAASLGALEARLVARGIDPALPRFPGEPGAPRRRCPRRG